MLLYGSPSDRDASISPIETRMSRRAGAGPALDMSPPTPYIKGLMHAPE